MSRQFERLLVDAMGFGSSYIEISPEHAAMAIADEWPELETAWNLYTMYGNLISEEEAHE